MLLCNGFCILKVNVYSRNFAKIFLFSAYKSLNTVKVEKSGKWSKVPVKEEKSGKWRKVPVKVDKCGKWSKVPVKEEKSGKWSKVRVKVEKYRKRSKVPTPRFHLRLGVDSTCFHFPPNSGDIAC